MNLFQKKLTLEQRHAWTGVIFISPWLLGFALLFARPIIESIIFTFHDIRFGQEGLAKTYVGLTNYKFAFQGDPEFIRHLTKALVNLAYELPTIIIYGFIIAMILNQQFIGRTIARSMFFLPVIIATGVVIQIMKTKGGMDTTLTEESVYLFQSTALQEMLYAMGINHDIVDYFTQIVNRIFDTSWKSGVQILLFLAGLQSVPRSYYEASDIEGATKWESFWKITFPLMSPITLVCIVYTAIDSFTYYENPVIQAVYKAFNVLVLHYSATMAWTYFIIVFAAVGAIVGLISRKVYYMED